MDIFKRLSNDYSRIEKALNFLSLNGTKQPKLKEIADQVFMSEYHFQRLFTRWVGISPKNFLQYLTIDSIKKTMKNSKSLLSTTIDGGLSSTSRLHDMFIKFEGISPGEYKKKAEGITIYYDFYNSPFGQFLLAVTEKGVCNLCFIMNDDKKNAIHELTKSWPFSTVNKSKQITEMYAKNIINDFDTFKNFNNQLFLKGTPFQIKVWEALLQIPAGCLITYKDVSLMIGMPNSTRAVANAIARNPIAFIIPCHRVIRKNGYFGGYRWGLERKGALIGWESKNMDERQLVASNSFFSPSRLLESIIGT